MYPQKTEQQEWERRSVAATVLTKHLSYSDLGRAQNAVPTESEPLSTEPERLRPGRCMHLGPASDGSRLSIVEAEGFVHHEKGQVQRG